MCEEPRPFRRVLRGICALTDDDAEGAEGQGFGPGPVEWRLHGPDRHHHGVGHLVVVGVDADHAAAHSSSGARVREVRPRIGRGRLRRL